MSDYRQLISIFAEAPSSAIGDPVYWMEIPMNNVSAQNLLASLAALLLLASPALAADDPAAKDAPQGAAVTVLKASKFCFPNLVEGVRIPDPRRETFGRPGPSGPKGPQILAGPGQAGPRRQNLARL